MRKLSGFIFIGIESKKKYCEGSIAKCMKWLQINYPSAAVSTSKNGKTVRQTTLPEPMKIVKKEDYELI